jgi:N-acetylglutamate synthase-like GNAT family acetyltransferase
MADAVDIGVRPARADDLAALQDIFRHASLSNEGDRQALLEHPEHLELPPDAVLRGNTKVAARGRDGIVVGFATVEVTGDAAELVDLFVEPESMGRGVGRALVADAVSDLAASGVRELRVDANPHAHAFYVSVGFTALDEVRTPLGAGLRMRRTVE